MKRISLSDESNSWFDVDRAEEYKEASRWDGNNWRSLATNRPWYHEHLYKTAGGKWILNAWSDYEGVLEEYTEIRVEEAYDWLIRNEHYDAVPEEQLNARTVDQKQSSRRAIYVPDALWDVARDVAIDQGMKRSELINELLQRHVFTWLREHPFYYDHNDDYDA